MSATPENSDLKVTIFDDGPIEIHGPLTLLDERGKVIKVMGVGETCYLCRCGLSSDKPLCDGTHFGSGFNGAFKQQP